MALLLLCPFLVAKPWVLGSSAHLFVGLQGFISNRAVPAHRACEVLPKSSLASFHMEHFLNEELRDLGDQMQLSDGNSCTIERLINAS